MKRHQQLITSSLQCLDKINFSNKTKLFIKLKLRGNILYKNYEYYLLPKLNLRNIKMGYIVDGILENYFDYIDLHIFDSMATPLASSMAYNLPSIGFWDSNILTVKPQYESLINRMIDVGMLVTNPDQLYASVDKIYNNPLWWFENEVQELRNEYVDLFSYCGNNWRGELNNKLLSIIADNHDKTIPKTL